MNKTIKFEVTMPDPVGYYILGFNLWSCDGAGVKQSAPNIFDIPVEDLPEVGLELVAWDGISTSVSVPADGRPHSYYYKIGAYNSTRDEVSLSTLIEVQITVSVPAPTVTLTVS